MKPIRRLSCAFVLAVACLLALPASAERTPREVSEAEARDVHSRLLTIDTHVDIGRGYATHQLDPGGFTRAQVDLPKMRAGDLDAVFLVVYTGQGPLTADGYASAREQAETSYRAIERMLRAYPQQIALARSADDIESIHASGRRIALLGMENGYPLGESVDDVALWAQRGVRYVGLTHLGHNQFAGSSNPLERLEDADTDAGLSDLGRALVAALNDHGVLVDVSHVGKRSMLEATALSRAPVIASHSSAHGLYANARNLDDEQLRAIRDNGGVAQMVAFRSYVADLDARVLEGQTALRERHFPNGWQDASDADINAYREAVAQLRREHGDVTLDQFIDHIDYAVKLIGIDHVGIASDFDGGGGVQGWDDASETMNVTHELLRRGYSEKEIAALWGGNVLRVLREAERQKRR